MKSFYIIYLVNNKIVERIGVSGHLSPAPFDNIKKASIAKNALKRDPRYKLGKLEVREVETYKKMIL